MQQTERNYATSQSCVSCSACGKQYMNSTLDTMQLEKETRVCYPSCKERQYKLDKIHLECEKLDQEILSSIR